MGVDVSAQLYIAVEVNEEDLLEEVTEKKVEHPCHAAARDKKFCPECGKKQRGEYTVTRKVPKQGFRDWLDGKGFGYDAGVDYDLDDFLHDCYHDTGELDLGRIQPDCEGDNDVAVFGVRIGSINAMYPRGKNPLEFSFEELMEWRSKVMCEAGKLGLKGQPKVYLVASASY